MAKDNSHDFKYNTLDDLSVFNGYGNILGYKSSLGYEDDSAKNY